MCGIMAFWAKESVPHGDVIYKLIEEAEKRGQDGIGFALIRKGNVVLEESYIPKTHEERTNCREKITRQVKYLMKVGDIFMLSCRATPETEIETENNPTMIQPLAKDGLFIVHNGGVTESVRILDYPYSTEIDSEIILAAYEKYNRNMRDTMEYLSGSFAFVLLDVTKNKLYSVCSFNPLAHMYVKGVGYFLHSSNEALSKALYIMTGATEDGMSVWENWYHHYLEGYTIIETDLDSGMQHKETFRPRFLHPTFDPFNPTFNYKKSKSPRVYVAASGGIDSGLTAHVLKIAGYDPKMIHFIYGQKGAMAERWAVKQFSAKSGIPFRYLNLIEQFETCFNRYGMLTDREVKIDSGENKIKSTIAWVPARNAIFASYLLAFAESHLIQHNRQEVYLASGWAQLSEETGGYPDNSFKFMEAIEKLKKYGCITGSYINFLPVMQNITKTEEWILGNALGFPFEYTVSCDNPLLHPSSTYPKHIVMNNDLPDGRPSLCIECGSTKLSMIAADRAGVKDPRYFHKGKGYVIPRPKMAEKAEVASVEDIINRLVLPEERKERVHDYCRRLRRDTM